MPKPNQTATVWWGYVSHTLRSCCFACFSCSQVARIDLLLMTHYDCRYIVFCSDCISALLGRTLSSVHANRSNNSGRESVGVCISSLSCHLTICQALNWMRQILNCIVRSFFAQQLHHCQGEDKNTDHVFLHRLQNIIPIYLCKLGAMTTFLQPIKDWMCHIVLPCVILH